MLNYAITFLVIAIIAAVLVLLGSIQVAMKINIIAALVFITFSTAGSFFMDSNPIQKSLFKDIPKWVTVTVYSTIFVFTMSTLLPQLGVIKAEEFAVYSDFYKAYINKNNAVEEEGFGLIDSDDVCYVYDGVENGKPTKKRKYLFSLLGDSEYGKVESGWSFYWINKKYLAYDCYSNDFVILTDGIFDDYEK
jgi:uncharacterized membrane protein YtjA (UPF0391 family)